MTPDQRAAVVVSITVQVEAVMRALEGVQASLAVLSMEAEATLDREEPSFDIPDADPATCSHPDIIKAIDQRICARCGTNLSA